VGSRRPIKRRVVLAVAALLVVLLVLGVALQLLA
jgi:hypothetical protein